MAGFVKSRKKIPITMKRVGKKLPQLVPVDVAFPLSGIRLDRPRDQIPNGAAVDTDGIVLHNGALESAPGRTPVSGIAGSGVVGVANYLSSAGVLESLVMNDDFPYRYENSSWALIPKNPVGAMTGLPSDLFWSTQIGSDLLFCQGVDPVFKYSGGNDFAILSADCPPAFFGIGHQGRLLIANTTESAIGYPYRVRWNVIDDIDNWTGAGSGYIDLDDTSDAVMSIGILNDYPVVFKEKCIAVGNRTGQISPAYEFFLRDSLNGTRCPHAVVNLGDRLAYIGEEDIFVFDLNKSTSIGEAVRSRFFDELNPEYRNMCVGYLVDYLDEVRFCIPITTSTYNNKEWIWNRKDGTWCSRRREVSSAGFIARATAPTWNSLSSTIWNSMISRWNTSTLQPTTVNRIFGTRSGNIYKEDLSSRFIDVDGAYFESFYEFGDIRIDQSKYSGVNHIEVRYRDLGIPCTLSVGLSVDAGKSWSTDTRSLQVGTASGRIFKTRFFDIISGTHIALRLYASSSAGRFEIVGVRLWMTSVGE